MYNRREGSKSRAEMWHNGQYFINQFTIIQPIPYVQGKVSRDDYITVFRQEYPAIRFANTVVPKEAKVLCLFLGNRGSCIDFPPVFEQPYASDGILIPICFQDDTMYPSQRW